MLICCNPVLPTTMLGSWPDRSAATGQKVDANLVWKAAI